MALLAALITSFPMLPAVAILAAAGSPMLSVAFAATMFLPALLGILLVQMPLKTILTSQNVGWGYILPAVTAANLTLVFGLAAVLDASLGFMSTLLLVLYTIFATAVWTTLDDRALHGREGYSRGRYHG
ncbi:hypothetical protein [Sphingomonas adhaesiva]|uniref:hypothetical protein n=1 Tax=Sphingomonas adhaesiva TaxID=28212 RepID=UPI002FF9F7BE